MVIRRFAAATVMGTIALGAVGPSVHAAVFQQYAPVAPGTGAVPAARAGGPARVAPESDTEDGAPARRVAGDTLASRLSDGITGDFTVDQYVGMAAGDDAGALTLARETSRFVLLQPAATGGAGVSARSFEKTTDDADGDAVNTPVVPTSPSSTGLTLSQMGILTWRPAPRTSVASLGPASLPAVSLNAEDFGLAGLPVPASAVGAAAVQAVGSFDSGSVGSGRGPSGAEFRLSNNALRQAAGIGSGSDEAVAMRAIRATGDAAVPEPASLGLLGLAGLGLLARRRRAV